MAHDPSPTTPAMTDGSPASGEGARPAADEVDDLVEDVSIDGMCGVY